ncbi:MAG: PExPT-CTERM protein [Deltaproteobacteria bacterium]|nr:PExPT-CTERM protein [Deltaproteobacteria bacterium]
MISQRQASTLLRAALVNVAMFGVVTAAVVGLWSSPSFAFGGCVQSPENPSLILGLLGGAVAGLPLLRAWFKSRLRK